MTAGASCCPSRLAGVQRLETRLDGPILLAPAVHGDERGFFLETEGFRLDDEANHQLYCPDGFAHDDAAVGTEWPVSCSSPRSGMPTPPFRQAADGLSLTYAG